MSAAGAPLQSQARQYQQIVGKGRELQVLLEVLPAFPVAAVQPEDALEHRDTAFDAGPKAGDFIRTARLVAGKDDAALESGKGFFPLVFPFLFLIGHALELAYKAVLLVDGATESDLKRIGHDLVKCRRKVQVCCPSRLEGLEEPGTEEIVRRIDPYYKAKAFEYHMTGLYSGLPASPHQVVTISAGTVKNIRDWVRSSVRQRIRDARNGA